MSKNSPSDREIWAVLVLGTQDSTAAAKKRNNGGIRQISAACGVDFGRMGLGLSFFGPYGQKCWYYYY
jgi:hypothetical protein